MIVKTIKTKINFKKCDFEKILQTLQKHKIIMLDESFYDHNENTETEDEYIERTKKMISILEKYLEKKSFFSFDEVNYDDFIIDSSEDIPFLETVSSCYDKLQNLILETKSLEDKVKELMPFKSLELKTNLNDLDYCNFLVGYVGDLDYLKNSEFITLDHLGESVYGYSVCLCYLKENELEVKRLLEDCDFTEFKINEKDLLVREVIDNCLSKIEENKLIINECKLNLSEYSSNIFKLKVLADKLENDKLMKIINYKKDEDSLYLEGFIKETDKDKLNEILSEYDVFIQYKNQRKNDVLPTATKNNKFVSQFESITNMFSAPDSKEIDPNPMMSIWYWLFFGFMMGDIGYGLVMITVFGLYLKLKNPKPNIRPLVTIFVYSGFSSIIFGIIFGSFFGADVGVIKFIGSIFNADWPSSIFKPMEEPLPVLIISIAIGVVHIICALIMKIRLSKKQNDLMGMFYGIGWILTLSGISILVLGIIDIISIIPGLILIGFGVVFILIQAISEGKSWGKIGSGFGGLYKAFNYLSDLLSYSRLLALCLSSGVIAYTMNLLAGMLQGSSGIMGVVGFLFSLVVYVIGHVFNLMLSLLSSYIHSSRLQYIEFFGKFYVGGGVEFKPLAIELNYLDNINYIKEAN